MKDNYCLKYLLKHPRLNARQAKCMEVINEFYFEIKNIKGKKNRVHGCTQPKFK
jgi:hypothetical protein